ncbi:MAG: hypothetical protein QM811_13170 [Pirellulales bacterium]
MSIACAVGLPGAEGIDQIACLARLEAWTERVRIGIENALRNRGRFPMYDELSDAEYRILTMYSVLYRHLGLTPNLSMLATSNSPYDGADASDHFIHAVLTDGYPVNCCTAPTIFATIGRRLGYPIKLVKARHHLFCRWDALDGERFNIEATDKGYYRYSDEKYHTWPRPIPVDELRHGVLLTSLTPNQDAAFFLCERGICLLENGRTDESLELFFHACRLDPEDHFYRSHWMTASYLERARQNGWRFPVPQNHWERSIYRSAVDYLHRVRANKARKNTLKPLDFQSSINVGIS